MEGLSGDLAKNEVFEAPVGSKIKTLQITNQIESRTREEENSCQENISVLATERN